MNVLYQMNPFTKHLIYLAERVLDKYFQLYQIRLQPLLNYFFLYQMNLFSSDSVG